MHPNLHLDQKVEVSFAFILQLYWLSGSSSPEIAIAGAVG